MIVALLLGLRQQASAPAHTNSGDNAINFTNSQKSEFDTGIPFIASNVVIPYSVLPQLYIFSSLFVAFIFEQPFDLRILIDFLWIWVYIRFFMKSSFNGLD